MGFFVNRTGISVSTGQECKLWWRYSVRNIHLIIKKKQKRNLCLLYLPLCIRLNLKQKARSYIITTAFAIKPGQTLNCPAGLVDNTLASHQCRLHLISSVSM